MNACAVKNKCIRGGINNLFESKKDKPQVKNIHSKSEVCYNKAFDDIQVLADNIVNSNRAGFSHAITINGMRNINERVVEAMMQMRYEAGTDSRPGCTSNALNRRAGKKSTPEQILAFPQQNNVQSDSKKKSVVEFDHM